MHRSSFFITLALFTSLLLCLPASPGKAASVDLSQDTALAEAGMPTDVPGYSMGALRKLADAIERTGVGADSIPALTRPKFLGVSDASLSMDDDEIVFIVHYPDRVRIYPQRILVWHEVVNDVIPDESAASTGLGTSSNEPAGLTYTVTYSPLTGTVTAFRSLAGIYPSSFGVSGELLNGNTVMYDRVSVSLWSQLLAGCIEGPMRGKRLERIPVLWARWGGVKSRYVGNAEVLSRSTGFRRNYGKDPYGSYQVKGTYYDNSFISVPLTFFDHRLPPKKQILGIEIDDLFGALQKDAVKEVQVLNFTLGVTPLVALYDEELDAVRVFDRRLGGIGEQPLTFKLFEGKFVDQETKTEWTAEGKAVYGRYRDKSLSPMLTIDSMWFAWAAFHRGTEIVPPPDK